MSAIKLRKAFKILNIEKNEIRAIFTYSLFIGLTYLIIPITAQSLVTIVSFGSLTQPLLVLTAVFFFLIFFSNLLRLLEMILVENIQQKLFARISLKLAIKLTQFDTHQLNNELIFLFNRFFEIFSIKKLSTFLMLGASILITKSFFGIFLLAFYHPFLLLFDVVFLAALSLIIFLPLKETMKLAIHESNAKYAISDSLEETAKFSVSFRFLDYKNFMFKKSDDLSANYLKARQSYFKKIIQQFIGLYCLNILANTAILLIGGILVIKNQMSLGQLVAAETIIWGLGSSVIELGKYLESFYDLVAACNKLSDLLNLPLEHQTSVSIANQKQIKNFGKHNFFAPQIQLQTVQFLASGKKSTPINEIILAGEKVGILGNEHGYHNLLIQSLLGSTHPQTGEIKYNNVCLTDCYLPHIRKTSLLLREESFFYGSLADNLSFRHHLTDIDHIRTLFDKFELCHPEFKNNQDFVEKKIRIHELFSESERKKLLIIRAILSNASLLIFDQIFDILPKKNLALSFDILEKKHQRPTVLVTTYQTNILHYFNKQIIFNYDQSRII